MIVLFGPLGGLLLRTNCRMMIAGMFDGLDAGDAFPACQ